MFRELLLLIVAGLLTAPASFGQESSPVRCRDALRPILLQTDPDRESLASIRSLCKGQADAGDPDALYQLSLLHLGLVDWRPEAAIPKIRSAADSGVAEAQYWLAWQRESGPLLGNDPELALHWYRLAGEREHRLALHRLAAVYANGELGAPVDAKKASLYRARAARCDR